MNTAGDSPRCPNCAQMINHARVTPRFGGLPELRTFECRPCGAALTESIDEIYRGGTLDDRPRID